MSVGSTKASKFLNYELIPLIPMLDDIGRSRQLRIACVRFSLVAENFVFGDLTQLVTLLIRCSQFAWTRAMTSRMFRDLVAQQNL